MNATPLSQEVYLRTVLDALPIPVFVSDRDARILDVNTAASKMTGVPPETIIKQLCGTVLHCLNEKRSKADCGQTDKCPDCIIRNSIERAIGGNNTVRKKTDMILETDGTEKRVTFLVSASPFEHEGTPLALVTLEDITEIADLREILPICANCRKIRDRDRVWQNTEKYLERYEGISFTHGLCPDCYVELYGIKPGEKELLEGN
jgi:PAS domain-containing protein